MVLEKVPFQTYTLDEDKKKEKSRVLTIRINETDEEILQWIKEQLNVKSESAVYSLSLDVFQNVIQSHFPRHRRAWLFKKERARLNEWK